MESEGMFFWHMFFTDVITKIKIMISWSFIVLIVGSIAVLFGFSGPEAVAAFLYFLLLVWAVVLVLHSIFKKH